MYQEVAVLVLSQTVFHWPSLFTWISDSMFLLHSISVLAVFFTSEVIVTAAVELSAFTICTRSIGAVPTS